MCDSKNAIDILICQLPRDDPLSIVIVPETGIDFLSAIIRIDTSTDFLGKFLKKISVVLRGSLNFERVLRNAER